MSSACFEGIKKFLEPCTPGVNIDSACEWLNRTVPHEKLFYRAGGTIIWDGKMEEVYGRCMCVLVRLGIIEPRPELCVCSTHHRRSSFEELTGMPMEAELVETVNSGYRDCVCRFHLNPTAYSSRAGK